MLQNVYCHGFAFKFFQSTLTTDFQKIDPQILADSSLYQSPINKTTIAQSPDTMSQVSEQLRDIIPQTEHDIIDSIKLNVD